MGPARGAAVRELDVALPELGTLVHGRRRPPSMQAWLGLRPLKRWRYVGAYGPELMVCVGIAHIGPIAQHWWAIALPDRTLYGRTTSRGGGVSIGATRATVAARGVAIDLAIDVAGGGEPIESVNPSGDRGYVWTRKQSSVPIRGTIELAGRQLHFDGEGAIDDTAGYHQRRTTWWWSAGVGQSTDGRHVGWNLVSGVNDDRVASEQTAWIDGVPEHIAPVSFADDLSGVAFEDGNALQFREWAAREHRANLLLVRSAYRQPFGTFSGTLPGGLQLASGYGVMEWHDARW